MKIIQLDVDSTFKVLEIEDLSIFLMSRFNHPGETSSIILPDSDIEVCGEFEDGLKNPADDFRNDKAGEFFKRPVYGTTFIVKYNDCVPASFEDSEIDEMAKLLSLT